MSPTAESETWLALDVGGANLKAAHSGGEARSIPFELWKQPDDLVRGLGLLLAALPQADRFALTMTAELCDCYPTKAYGVRAVIGATLEAVGGRAVEVWGTDGQLHPVASILDQPALAAASNWLALATLASRLIPEGPGLLIDVGSTTTDLIPLLDGAVAVVGRTDTDRLRTGELVYAGVRRTPIAALAVELPFRGATTGLAPELFATTLDAYLTLGDLEAEPDQPSPADGRPSTPDAALDRLARMVGADRDTYSIEDALAFSETIDATLTDRLTRAADGVTRATVGRPRAVVIAGSGEFLARRVAARVVASGGSIISLAEAWGPVASSSACAFALVQLAAERGG